MIYIQSFTFNDFQENTYILFDETKEAIIIDAGCFYENEKHELSDFIVSKKLKPVKLINTHCHIDHVLGNEYCAKKYDLKLYLHKDELKTYSDAEKWTAMFGIPPLTQPQIIEFIDENSIVNFGNSELSILSTPGHSVASISFYNKAQNFVIAGDVLFRQSIGRTDLPGGNFDVLISSIKNKIFTLPDETIVYSGHGIETTVGYEKTHNSFLQ